MIPVCCWLLVPLISNFHADAVKVRLSSGIAEGKAVRHGIQTVHTFKAIPFAEPPVGERRFQAPERNRRWHGVLDATEYARPCMSNTGLTTSPQKNVSEDCLYVNVFADKRCLRSSCPVLFYIHGGGFYYDSAVMFNDTEIIDKFASQRVIFVIPAYRLGLYGFMDLGEEQPDAPYNVGLYDIILALRWVKKEIPQFGGDPERITVMGNSAGAMAVLYLLVTPVLEAGVFAQAVISSGIGALEPHTARLATTVVAEKLECKNGTIRAQLECLRRVPAEKLSLVSRITEHEWGTSIGPQTDSVLLPGENIEKLLRRNFKPMPLLISTTTDEMSAPFTEIPYDCQFMKSFDYRMADTLNTCIEHYANLSDSRQRFGRDAFHALTVHVATLNRKRGGRSFVEIFGQHGHTLHARNLAYFFGLHRIENMTADDRALDRFYPRAYRNFFMGERPVYDWLEVNERGENYYFINFDEANKTRPHMVRGEIYNADGVNFWLREMASVEREARWEEGLERMEKHRKQDEKPAEENTSRSESNHRRLFRPLLVALPGDDTNQSSESSDSFGGTTRQPAIRFRTVLPPVTVRFVPWNGLYTAYWFFFSMAILVAAFFLIYVSARLLYRYQNTQGYQLSQAGEGTKILTRVPIRYG